MTKLVELFACAVPEWLSASDVERIHGKIVVADSGCWLWTGTASGGYGVVRVQGKTKLVHRIVYEIVVGSVPPLLHHGCETPLCCNPDCLKPKAGRFEHSLEHRAEACRRGHPFTEQNTYVVRAKGRRSYRQCRLCRAVARARCSA